MADYHTAEQYVLGLLQRDLSPKLLYHNVSHTVDVITAAEHLAQMEGIAGDLLLLLKTGALYHDIGFLKQYGINEPIGARIAFATLRRFGYARQEVHIVEKLVLATQPHHIPKTKLEKIIRDADHDNLGREDFYIKTELLRQELTAHSVPHTPREWFTGVLSFLKRHQYWTQTAVELRQGRKEQHIREIEDLLGQ